MIDLHMHSDLSNLRGDSVTFYSIEQSVRQLQKEGIKHFAFTEHDKFSSTFINEVQDYISKNNVGITIYPGFELTINKQDGTPGHILFIFKNHVNNKKIEDIVKKITAHYNCKTSLQGVDKLIGALKKYDIEFLMIPHGNKSNGISFDDISKDAWTNVEFIESLKHGTKYIKVLSETLEKELLELTFSDTHHWREYKFPKHNNKDTLNKVLEKLGGKKDD